MSLEEAAERFNILFHLPSPAMLASALIGLGALVGAVHGSIAEALALVAGGVVSTLALMALGGPMNARRALGTTVASMCVEAPLHLASSLTLGLGGALIVGLTAYTSLMYMVARCITGRRALSLAPPLAGAATCYALYSALASSTPPWPALVASQGASIASMWAGLWVIDRAGASVMGVGALEAFHAFSEVWLRDRIERLESLMGRLSEPRPVEVVALAFTSSRGVEGVMLTTTAHSGPFRGVGGSELPSTLAGALEGRLGGVAMPFHTATTHEMDPATHGDVEAIVEAAVRAVEESTPIPSLASPPVEVEGGGFKVRCQVLGVPVVTVTWTTVEAQDLPLEDGYRLRAEATRLGALDALVVEAHNLKGGVEGGYCGGVVEVGVEAIEGALSSSREGVVRAAFSSISLPPDVGGGEVGGGGLKVALIEAGGSTWAHVLVDGNNMSPRLRRMIVEAARRGGADGCEVYTTDTHSVVARRAIRGGYRPVGVEADCEAIAGVVEREVARLRGELREVSLRLGRARVEVKVLGSGGLGRLLEGLRRCYWATLRVLPCSLAAPSLACWALMALLG